MPADSTFTIKFKPEGDTELIKAINALARAQKKLETGVTTSAAATKGATVVTKQAHTVYDRLTAKLIAQGKTWKDLGVGTATTTMAMKGNLVAIEQLKLAMGEATRAGMFAVRNNRLLSNSFATLRSHLLLYAFAAMLVERAIVSMVRAYGMQEAANIKLQAGLANVQGTVDGVTQRLIDYSSALQQVTAFGDEVITTGMVQLTTFNLNEEAIKALTPQVLNVARAIQTASGTMPELNSLFIAFGKSTSTAVSALTRYGVVLTDTEKKQLELMDANTRAIAVADILEKQYGGIAAAYAKTTAGMLEATSAAFGDAKEAIGEAFAPLVLQAAEALKALAESIHPGVIRRWIDAAKIMVTVLGAIKVGLVAARIAQVGFTLAFASTPWGLIAVVASVAAAQLLKIGGAYDDTSTKLKDLNKKTVENVDATKLLTDEQISGIAALEHRLKLLKEEDPVMKILIALKHEWSEAEKKLATEIVETTEALKAQAEAEREIKREAAKTQRELDAAAKREKDKLERLFPAWDTYKKKMDESRESHIHMQKLLKDYIAILDASRIAHNLETDAMKEANRVLGERENMQEAVMQIERDWTDARRERTAELLDQEIQFQNALAESRRHAEELRKEIGKPPDPPDPAGAIAPLTEALDIEFGLTTEAGAKRLSLERQITNEAIELFKSGKMTQVEVTEHYHERMKELNEMFKEGEIEQLATVQDLYAETYSAISDMVMANQNRIISGIKDQNRIEIEELKKTYKYKSASEKKQAQMENAIKKKREKDVTDAFRLQQLAQVGQVWMNIALAVARQFSDTPLPAALLAQPILMAIGGVQSAAIMAQKPPKMEHGGMVGGNRHSQGGTMIEAERGEFILSRKAVSKLGADNLQKINNLVDVMSNMYAPIGWMGSNFWTKYAIQKGRTANKFQEGGLVGSPPLNISDMLSSPDTPMADPAQITVNVSGNVLTQDFVEGELAENIKEAIRRGTDFGIG